jgi:hypothetical protein
MIWSHKRFPPPASRREGTDNFCISRCWKNFCFLKGNLMFRIYTHVYLFQNSASLRVVIYMSLHLLSEV